MCALMQRAVTVPRASRARKRFRETNPRNIDGLLEISSRCPDDPLPWHAHIPCTPNMGRPTFAHGGTTRRRHMAKLGPAQVPAGLLDTTMDQLRTLLAV